MSGLHHFGDSVPANGYRWWYLDALSDDARYGIAIIGFVGSVFSPYYFSARKKAAANPEDLFGEETASKWADLAFMGMPKK